MAIRIDYSNMLASNVPGGIEESVWRDARGAFEQARRAVSARRAASL
jgi:hypothetical protein